jgi:aminoglycoside phosphotransferase (APT) family kinase protein
VSQAVFLPPARRDLDAISDDLAGWLQARMPQASDVAVHDLSYPVGAGLSNETILFEATWREGGRDRAEGLVLRLKPSGYQVYMEIDFEGQFALQQAIHRTGVAPVPEVLWFEHDSTLFGAPFFVMKRLRGKVAVSYPPYPVAGWIAEATDAERATIWRNGVEALGKLSRVPIEAVKVLDKPRYGATGWEQEWNLWMASHAWSREGRDLPTCDRTLEWLDANRPTERRSGLCWGDSRLGNLMYDDDFEVLAVMDWEGASLGGGLQDLGFWVLLDQVMARGAGLSPPGFGSRAETIALWEDVSGLSARDIDWYEIFGAFKLASHINRKHTLDGTSRPGANYENNPANRFIAEKFGWPAPADVV